MKSFLLFFLLIFTQLTLANEARIELNPSKPVVGEVFQAYFRIFTESDEEPVITFSPGNVEVVGKANQGTSTRTVYANGKLTVTREVTVVYELVSSKAGMASLRDISIQLGDKTLRQPALTFNVLKEPEVLADVFVMADVPKKELFVGEGIVIRYFLYSKVPVSSLDVKKYPKLNNFLKRFLQEPERTERVSVNGDIYLRAQIYAAKLFPEKTGELKIDPLHLSATYPVSRGSDPFGNFGFNRELKTRTVTSDTVKLIVKPLPTPVPPHFTGLVGRHEFQLDFSQSKLIVNEPLEFKLSVTGGGALENLEAPKIIDHPGLEEFESNGDLKIANPDQATKIFEYTFLAKENLKIPPKEMDLSYFDPDTMQYVSSKISIPEIEVAGGGAARPAEKAPKENAPQPSGKVNTARPDTLALPAFENVGHFKTFLPLINFTLAALAFLISLSWIVKNKPFTMSKSKTHIPSGLKKGNFNLSEFIQWISPLIVKTGKAPSSIIQDSSISEESKKYFLDLIEKIHEKNYSAQKGNSQFNYKSTHFKELSRYIESVKNENTSRSA